MIYLIFLNYNQINFYSKNNNKQNFFFLNKFYYFYKENNNTNNNNDNNVFIYTFNKIKLLNNGFKKEKHT